MQRVDTKKLSMKNNLNRLCALCRNHGLKIPVKGHKRFCAYKLCVCRECCLVKERQRVVALHLYYRRAQEQEESDRKPDGRHALRDRSGEDLSGAVREQMLYESLLAMRRVFPVGEEAVPLLLCILKQSRSLQEASWKIIQGTQTLISRGHTGLDSYLAVQHK